VAGKLQSELKKKRPFDSLEQEAALGLARAADKLRVRFERLFRQFGLASGSQYNVLRILRGEGQPMRVLDIAARTVTEVPGITGLIDRLEKMGLVARRRCEEDRRVVYVSITAKGLALLAEIDEPLAELHRDLMCHLSHAELRELVRLLDKVRAPLADDA
jgi:DNA-binding MarR family transcriptional regulator